jgi:predicted TIM-barrel fold metal-dependent hydrolase
MATGKHPPVIDFHAHMLEEELLRRAAGKTVLSGYGANPHGGTPAVNETTFQKFDPSILAALIQRVGADRLVMGSDYPVGEIDPVGFIEKCPGISKAEATMMTGGTAARLLGLPAET